MHSTNRPAFPDSWTLFIVLCISMISKPIAASYLKDCVAGIAEESDDTDSGKARA
jgi:hypothetical protein